VDCVFLGSRSDDVDPVHGPLALERDTVEANGCLFVFPLRNWTEGDVWEASALMGVEQNKARYVEKDMTQNADYWDLCCACLKPGAGDAIICPKVGDRVFRLGNYLNLEERREARERTFINLKRRDTDV
jgi:3'-phosphoadenosine 5'-phosphosulfate sulfotransferase (PAPS reductase)/FAD synthetase